jgi:Leucine-rich repeat (LRR) protein
MQTAVTPSARHQLLSWWQELAPNWKFAFLHALGYLEHRCTAINVTYLGVQSAERWSSTQGFYTSSQRIPVPTYAGNFDLHRFERLSVLDIQRITELQSLTLWQCQTLEPLKMLTQLKSLNISQNPITDLSPLTHLQTLEHLNCEKTPIRSLQPLRSLPKLSFLNIRKCSQLAPSEILEWVAHSKSITLSDIDFTPPEEKATRPLWEDKNNYGVLLFALAFILIVFVTQLFQS